MDRQLSVQAVIDGILADAMCEDTAEKEIYRIGDLAREFDVSLRTLRFYEDRGLVSPNRSGSTRLYSPDDRRRIHIILLAKNVGFSLVDIQDLLACYDAKDSSGEQLEFVRSKFHEQLDSLLAQREELDKSINDMKRAVEAMENQFSRED